MNFIYYYFGLGVLTFLFVYGAHHVGKVERRHARVLLLEKKPTNPIEHAANILGNAIPAALVVLLWPAVVVYAIKTEKERRGVMRQPSWKDDPTIRERSVSPKETEMAEQ
jgi:hypothetical protein